MSSNYRIGQIVPSSNTTMETELPRILAAHERIHGTSFTYHSSRMRMKQVTPKELASMNEQMTRCAAELDDADVDVVSTACLVAIMAQSPGFHSEAEENIAGAMRGGREASPVVSSAGALVDVVRDLGGQKVSILTPYMRELTDKVAEYIEHAGIEVVSSRSLEIADNLQVGRLDPLATIDEIERLDTSGADVVILSACVQMPSLDAVQYVEHQLGKPVITAVTSTARRILQSLSLPVDVPGFGAALRAVAR